MVWGTTLQWLLYGNFPSALAFLGMINIVAAGLYATVRQPFSFTSPRYKKLMTSRCTARRGKLVKSPNRKTTSCSMPPSKDTPPSVE